MLRVLYIEDDPSYHRHLTIAVKKAGIELMLDFASDCTEGLAKATSTNYDFIFVDIDVSPGQHLPGIQQFSNGQRLAEFLKFNTRARIIAATGYSLTDQDMSGCFDDVLYRPFLRRLNTLKRILNMG